MNTDESGGVYNGLRVVLLGHGASGLLFAKTLYTLPGVTLVGIYPWCDHPATSTPAYHAQEDAWLKHWAKQRGIPLLSGWRTHEPAFRQWLAAHQVNWVQLSTWGEILKPPLLGTSGLHIINYHPSPLPWHKGPNPYASVIRQNLSQTAITFHQVDAGIDTGPVLYQQPVDISPNDTGGSLKARCEAVASNALADIAAMLMRPDLPLLPQDALGEGCYFPHPTMEEALIQWLADPAAVERNARALHPWLNPFAWWNNQTLTVFDRLLLCPLPDGTPVRPAGSVCHTHKRYCMVHSRDPKWAYHLFGYRLALGNQALPPVLSRLLGMWLFKPCRGSFWHTPMLENLPF